MNEREIESILDNYANKLEEFIGMVSGITDALNQMDAMLQTIEGNDELKKNYRVKSEARNVENSARDFMRLLPQLQKQLQSLYSSAGDVS